MITSGLENLHKKREKERRELKIALKRKENSQKEKEGEYIMEYLIRVDCICRSFCNQNSTF